MSRIINVDVSGEFVNKDNKNAGTQGEGNAVTLHITLSEDWKGYSKRIVWRNALGENPVAILLYDGIKDQESEANPLVFDTKIPMEAMTEPGWCSFTIEGFKEGDPSSVAITVTEYLLVAVNDGYYAPKEPTPTQAQQLQYMMEETISETADIIKNATDALEAAEDDMSVWDVWDPAMEYVPLNKVERLGSSYICLVENKGIDPVVDINADGTYWRMIAAKGERGEQGIQGRDGPEGPRGVAGFSVAVSGMVAFNVDENGHLWCCYVGDEKPGYYLGEDGHLYLEIT